MIDIQKCRSEFVRYVKQFDFRDDHIMQKFHHSFRVMEYSISIAKSLNLSEQDIEIATIIGLYHDIGRFTQWKQYKTYEDRDSIDHADAGAEILLQENFLTLFSDDEEIQNTICKAIQNHNKLHIDDKLIEKELLFTKIIRDADKLDIMIEQNNEINTKCPSLNSKLISFILNHKLCEDPYVRSCDEDHLLRTLAFIFDLHFGYSFKYLLDKQIIEKKLSLLEQHFGENDEMKQIKETILNYMKERC